MKINLSVKINNIVAPRFVCYSVRLHFDFAITSANLKQVGISSTRYMAVNVWGHGS